MSHQPFETWIFSEEPLEEEQKKMLESHLEACESCTQLSSSWLHIQDAFSEAPTASPLPGFTQRWHTRLSLHRQQMQQRRLWLLVLGLFAAAGVIFLVLAGLNLISTPWQYAIGKLIAEISLTASRLSKIIQFVIKIFNSAPILIPIVIIFGVGLISAALTLIVTWFMSVIRIYKPIEGAHAR